MRTHVRLHLTEFYAITADLYLVVLPAQIFNAAIYQETTQVACREKDGRLLAERIWHEPLSRETGLVPVAGRKAVSADMDLACHADRNRFHMTVQDIHLRIGDRLADGHRLTLSRLAHLMAGNVSSHFG